MYEHGLWIMGPATYVCRDVCLYTQRPMEDTKCPATSFSDLFP